MFNLFKNFGTNVEALILLVKELNIKITNTTINDTLQSHPDYPSLYSISETLHQWHIDNIALWASNDQINELKIPFLAHIKTNGQDSLVLVKYIDIDKNRIVYKKSITQRKENVISKEQFFNIWTGYVLIASSNESSNEKLFLKKRKNERLKNIPLFAFLCLIPIVAAFYILKLSAYDWLSIKQTVAYSLIFFLKIIGLFATVLLIWYEIDKSNSTVQKICTEFVKTNCSAILSSKSSKFMGVLSWSEIGFFYFAGGFLMLIIGNLYVIDLTIWLNLFTLPYIFFSIYYQWRVAKQWCILCLIVQGILFLEFLTAIIFKLYSPLLFNNFFDFTLTLFCFLLPVISWFLVKPYLIKFQTTKQSDRELLRLKKNPEIFSALLEKQKKISYTTDGLGILLGNPESKNTFLKVCSPYCGPCSKSHVEISDLIKSKLDLRIQIIFTATSDPIDKSALPVKHFFAISQQKDSSFIENVLNDWYSSSEKNYQSFADKYPVNQELLLNQLPKIKAMEEWCNLIKIEGTPTFFFNGSQLPEIYKISDIKYFIDKSL